jgi:hypothetical protein
VLKLSRLVWLDFAPVLPASNLGIQAAKHLYRQAFHDLPNFYADTKYECQFRGTQIFSWLGIEFKKFEFNGEINAISFQ